LILASILLALNVFLGGSGEGSQPEWTSLSSGENGTSLLYDCLKEMGFKVFPGYSKISMSSGIHDVHIVIHPSSVTGEELQSMLDWVGRGGRMIYMDDEAGIASIEALILEEFFPSRRSYGNLIVAECGLGQIALGRAELVSNINLMNNSSAGQSIASILNSWEKTGIYFSEYYHRIYDSGNAWRTLPSSLKALVYQLALLAALIVWHLGKRFGKPVPLYEEIERDENEFLKALANLYRKAGMGSIIFESFHSVFIANCARAFHVDEAYARENLALLWVQNNLENTDALQRILSVSPEKFNGSAFFARRRLASALADISKCESALAGASRSLYA
jgi:hypothetical protein